MIAWPNKIAILIVKFVSGLFRTMGIRACRFYPSCSAYAVEAFSRRHFVKACLMTGRRLLSCHPFCQGGFDPIR